MFLKGIAVQKRNLNFNSLLCFNNSHCFLGFPELLTIRLLSIDSVCGTSNDAKNTVRNKKFSPNYSRNHTVCYNSQCHISSAAVKISNCNASHSPFIGTRKVLSKLQSCYSCGPARWYSDKRKENLLSEEVHLVDNTPCESWVAHYTNKSLQRLSNVKDFSQVSNSIDQFKSDTDMTHFGNKGAGHIDVDLPKTPSQSLEKAEELLLSIEAKFENMKGLNSMIINAQNYSEVLNVFKTNGKLMRPQQYHKMMKKLILLIDGSNWKEAQEHPVMEELCNHLKRNCCRYDPPQLISLLKLLVKIKLPERSPLVLTTLKMIRRHFNKLNMKELLFVDFLLRDEYPDPIGIALKMAIPIALENRCCNKPLPSDLNLFHLSLGLTIGIRSNSITLAEKFMEALYKNNDGFEDFSVTSAVTIASGLLTMFQRWKTLPNHMTQELLDDVDMQVVPEHGGRCELEAAQELKLIREVLLKEVLQYMAKNFAKLSDFEARKVLVMISNSFSQKDFCAYNQPLICAYTERAIGEDWPLSTLATAVTKILKMNEVNESLLQAFLKKVSSSTASELKTTELAIMPLIHALASSNSLNGWNEGDRHVLLAKLLQHPSAPFHHVDNKKIPLWRLGYDLASLGYFEPTVHQYIIDTLSSRMKTLKSNVLRRIFTSGLVTLWQAQELLNNEQQRVQMDSSEVQTSKERAILYFQRRRSTAANRRLVRQMLLQTLSSHGPNSVITGVQTKHGICVDHVMVVRGAGELVPQPGAVEEMVCIDDLCVPENATVYAVVQIDSHLLFNKHTLLKPLVRLTIQMLAAEGVTAVPFIMPQFLLNNNTAEKIRFVTSTLEKHGLCR